MKTKKILTTLLATASVVALFTSSPIIASAANKAATTTQAKTNSKNYVIKDTPDLSKWGYIINVNTKAQPVFVGRSNYQKMLNNPQFKGSKVAGPKEIKNVKFKVVKIMEVKKHNGSPLYLITSKDHKYNSWTPNAGLQYYAINQKALQPIVKRLKRINKRNYQYSVADLGAQNKKVKEAKKKNKRDLDLAIKAAGKLKGTQRKFVLESLNKMKKDFNEEIDNILAWSIID